MEVQKPNAKAKRKLTFDEKDTIREKLERTKLGSKSLPALKTDDLQYALFNLVRFRLRDLPLKKMSPDLYERLIRESEEMVADCAVAAIRKGDSSFFEKLSADLKDWEQIIKGKITEPLLPNHKRLLEILKSFGAELPTKVQLRGKQGYKADDLVRQTDRMLKEMHIKLEPR
jgi:hypothetical protein